MVDMGWPSPVKKSHSLDDSVNERDLRLGDLKNCHSTRFCN